MSTHGTLIGNWIESLRIITTGGGEMITPHNPQIGGIVILAILVYLFMNKARGSMIYVFILALMAILFVL